MLDIYYIVLVLPTIFLSLIAQIAVKSTFSKYSRQQSKRGITGAQIAKFLMKENGITDVRVERVSGNLTDHYDPSNKVLRLSEPVCNISSIAAVGVAAHETGHAIQHAKGYGPLVLRSTLVPLANIGSSIGPTLAIIGLFLSLRPLLNIGLLLFSCAVLFYIVTLPVEINASRRAIAILRSSNALDDQELAGAKKVLFAAAMTYVASALTAIANFARLLLISRDRRN